MNIDTLPIHTDELQQELNRITDVIIQKCNPEKIIVFGSLASKDFNRHSDIDLAIIMDTEMRFMDRLLYLAKLTKPQVGVDFLVYTPDEFASMLKQGNLFLTEEVLGKGRVVYEKVQ